MLLSSLIIITILRFSVIPRVVNLAVLVLVTIVVAILFEYQYKYRRYFSYAISIRVLAILFHLFFWQYSIPILLSSGALVNSVNNNSTVFERLKAMTGRASELDTATVLTH